MVRLHVEPERLRADVVVATDDDHRYLTRVLRLGPGDRVTLFDGEGAEADAEITRVGPRAVELHVTARRLAPPRQGPELILLQGLARGEKLDLVVQKATELGAHRIVPVTTERAVPRLEVERSESRLHRWRKIAREAARQSGRTDLPAVEALTTFSTAVASVPQRSLRLLFWEQAKSHRLKEVLPTSVEGIRAIVLAVGPEGGFSDEEVERAKAAGFVVAGLGPRTLRTETAALAALAVVNFALGDMG